MKRFEVLGWIGWIVLHVPINAFAAVPSQDSLADLFSMEGQQMITAPEHLGIINGKITVGTPGGQAARVDGLWAPPFVSSDFALRVEIFGKEVPTPTFKWWPFKIQQRGDANSVEVATTLVLVSGQRAGLLALTLHNAASRQLEVPLVFKARGTLDRCDLWEFAQARSTTATKSSSEDGALTLSAGERSIVVQSSGTRMTWDSARGTGTHTLTIEAGGTATVHLAFAIGPSPEATTACKAIAAEPAKAMADADTAHARQVAHLFQRVPRLVSDNKELERFYHRSLIHLIMNRWDVPEFVLHPYYSTGSIRGGCVTEYLWNYGESQLLLPLYDPAAHREHLKQFLQCDMTAHFAFNPMDGKAHGPWYMVNQEKIVGLVYHHVRITGDTAFLEETVDGRTVLEHVLKNARHGDDGSKPVGLIDYGPSNSHLELRRQYTYHHVMPDLNGRRYANYLLAARLADVAGKPAPQLRERAAALKPLLKQKLWNPQTRWFDFINGQGQPETRWTVQMFYLLGSGVLDQETEAGLIGHLNDREFLGEYGLHSLAKGDAAYDPADVDNGGPGACTSFPPNVAFLLCQAGRPREAEDLVRRCVWWGSRMPYWGDSICADRGDYRHDTPLQCTIDAVAVAGYFIFGMFGVDPQFDGSLLVSPRPAAWAPRTALRGVRIRDAVFDIELDEREFRVVCAGETAAAPVGRAISVKKNGGATELSVTNTPGGQAKP